MAITQIQVRRGASSDWTITNPTLAAGEIGFETDTGKFKIGKGSVAWTFLAYATGGTASYAVTSGTAAYSAQAGTAVSTTSSLTSGTAVYAYNAGTVPAISLTGSTLASSVVSSSIRTFGTSPILNSPTIGSATISNSTITGGSINVSDLYVNGQQVIVESDLGTTVATLDEGGKLSFNQIPSITISNTFIVATLTEMTALVAEVGDIAIVTEENISYILSSSDPTVLEDWKAIVGANGAVLSVDGETGAVDLTQSYVPQSRTISTTSPLSGGGTLTTNQVLSIQDATTSQKGAVQLTESVSSSSMTTAATPNSVKTVYDIASAAVPQTRTITTNTPLTGGGSLTGNLTLGVNPAGIGTIGVVQLTDSISSTSTTTAATPNSVKTAYDLANNATPKLTTLTGVSPVTIDGASGTAINLSVSRTIEIGTASTSNIGVVQLENSTSSTSTTTAATPNSVKTAYDLANTAKITADSAYTLGTAAVPQTALGVTVPTLVNGTIPISQLPSGLIPETFVVAGTAAMLALTTVDIGDLAILTGTSQTFIYEGPDPSLITSWTELTTTASVSSVDGRIGVVTLSDLYDAYGAAATAQSTAIAAGTAAAGTAEYNAKQYARAQSLAYSIVFGG